MKTLYWVDPIDDRVHHCGATTNPRDIKNSVLVEAEDHIEALEKVKKFYCINEIIDAHCFDTPRLK